MIKLFSIYNSFLNRATGILSCSRYFATVRRAILYPFSCNNSVSFSSLKRMLFIFIFYKITQYFFYFPCAYFFTAIGNQAFTKEKFKPVSSKFCLNKFTVGTRLTVEISSIVLSAISFNIIGCKSVSSPVKKNSF